MAGLCSVCKHNYVGSLENWCRLCREELCSEKCKAVHENWHIIRDDYPIIPEPVIVQRTVINEPAFTQELYDLIAGFNWDRAFDLDYLSQRTRKAPSS